MDLRLLVVVAFCFTITSASINWLALFACNTSGNFSVINPTNYSHAEVLNTGADCVVDWPENSTKIFTISDCPLNPVNIMVDHKSTYSGLGLIGGRGAATYVASCNVATYGALAEVTAEANIVDLSVDAGFTEEFIESDPQVEIKLRGVLGAEGYTRFTVGYPLTLEFIGPAGTLMKPKKCVAYSGLEKDGWHANQTFIEDGCSLDKTLVMDFQVNYTTWFEEGLPEVFPTADVGIFAAEMDVFGEEEAEEEEPEVQPTLALHMFAFRYRNSVQMILRCDIQLCPSESEDCDFTCE